MIKDNDMLGNMKYGIHHDRHEMIPPLVVEKKD
jgi:hypothetical protein